MACLLGTGDYIFAGIFIFILLLLIGFLIFNIVEFNKVRQNPSSTGISSNTAIALMVINGIFAFLALILAFWIGYILWISRDVVVTAPAPAIVAPAPAVVAPTPGVRRTTVEEVANPYVPAPIVTPAVVPTSDIEMRSYPVYTPGTVPTRTVYPASAVYPNGTPVTTTYYPR